MNIMELGALGEFVGSFGVIATLIYLAAQVRHSSKSERASMQHAVLSEFRTLVAQLTVDKQLSSAFESLEERREIAPEAKPQFMMWVGNIFRVYEELQEFSHHGLISTEFWDSRRTNMKHSYLAHPEIEAWWNKAKVTYSPKFVSLGDKLIEELRNS